MGTLVVVLSAVALLAVVVGFVVVRRRPRGEVLEPPVTERRDSLKGAKSPTMLRDGQAPSTEDELTAPEIEVEEVLPGVLPREVLIVGPEVSEEEQLTDEELERLAMGEETLSPRDLVALRARYAEQLLE